MSFSRLVIYFLIATLISHNCQFPLSLLEGGNNDRFKTPDPGDGNLGNPPTPQQSPSPAPPPEQVVQEIPLSEPLSDPNAEISGMAWYGDQLILVPQFPGQYASEGNDGLLFALEKVDILASLAGERSIPVKARPVPLEAPGLGKQIPGFEGFEALAVDGKMVYLTIESSNGRPMMGYLVQGEIAGDLSRVILDISSLIPLPPRSRLVNKTDEALVLDQTHLFTIYEANGAKISPDPKAYRFDLPDLNKMETVPFPGLEFRITDATPADERGHFWAINTFWPVDIGVATDADPLALQYGEGATHQEFLTVERLVELQIEPGRISLTESPPLQLALIDDFTARNWEGLARLDNLGFLLVTDEHPASILAYVPLP